MNRSECISPGIDIDGCHFINYKIVNFRDLIKLKKIKNFSCNFETIPFNEFRETKKLFQKEKYENPKYYDEDYSYMEEEYKKNWTRFNWINTVEHWNDWYSLASEYEVLEKEHNYRLPTVDCNREVIIKNGG